MTLNVPVPAYASLSRRFAALFLDGLILFIPCAVANSILPVAGGVLVASLYTPVFESSVLQATLGKRAMGIQVAASSGGRIPFSTALIRFLMKILSSMILAIGFFVALFTRRKQALHDLIADTVVVDGRSEASVSQAWTDQVKAVLGKFEGADSSLSALERLQALREKGALTEDEFQNEKAKLLGTR